MTSLFRYMNEWGLGRKGYAFIQVRQMKYKVIFDNGKPYEETYENEAELKEALKKFYLDNTNDKSHYNFDVKVFCWEYNPSINNLEEVDITESQFINEIVGDII